MKPPGVINKTNPSICAKCKKYIRKVGGYTKTVDEENISFIRSSLGAHFKVGDKLCDKCRRYVPGRSKLNITVKRSRSGDDCASVPSHSHAENLIATSSKVLPQTDSLKSGDDYASVPSCSYAANLKTSSEVSPQTDPQKSGGDYASLPTCSYAENLTTPSEVLSPTDPTSPTSSQGPVARLKIDHRRGSQTTLKNQFRAVQTSFEPDTTVNMEDSVVKTRSSVTLRSSSCHGVSSTVQTNRNASDSDSLSQGSVLTSVSSSSSDSPEFIFAEPSPTETITMPFARVVCTHKYCFICGYGVTSNLKRIPLEARIQCFMKTRIFIPKNNRCCANHLLKDRLYEDRYRILRIASHTSEVEVKELSGFINQLCIEGDKSILDNVADFSMPEEKLKVFTGLTWEQVIELRQMSITMRNSASRDVTQALVTFLFKMRYGSSNELISSIFDLQREQQVSEFCHSVLQSFEKDILPQNFGFAAFSREELIMETSDFAKALHGWGDTTLVIICDGTYLKHQKSANNYYQRKSYSGQKKTALCKPFTICTTNGFVVDVAGPYHATLNDAEILRRVLQDPSGLKTVLQKGDVFVLDRGFRDVVKTLEDSGFAVMMPSLKTGNHQLTTEQANASRLVTCVRWVVEAVHGIVGKKNQILHHQLDNKLLSKAGLFCKVACFLHNKFGKRLNSNRKLQTEILRRINETKNLTNTFAQEVEESGWKRKRRMFQMMKSTDVLDFPELTEDQLKIYFTGKYQYGLSISYLAEILDAEGNITIFFHREEGSANTRILKAEVPSRHKNRETYRVFIKYRCNDNTLDGILGQACNCDNGLRTIGACAHVACIIYYLSYARFQSRILRPAQHLSELFQNTGIEPSLPDDSDTED